MKKMKGSIQLILGPMFSGKTTELMKRVRRYQVVKRNCLVIGKGSAGDGPAKLVSHNTDFLAENVINLENLDDIKYHEYEKREVIAIDQAQFFENISERAETYANDGKVVIVAGLSGNFKREKYGSHLELIPKAEEIIFLSAICKDCGEPAHFTKRVTEEKELTIIGGSKLYKPVCREHFFNPR